jgi:glycogen debranching enzyme
MISSYEVRRKLRRVAGAGLSALWLTFTAAAVGGQSSSDGRAPSRPTLSFADSTLQATLAVAYRHALENLLDVNTLRYDAAVYDATGLMADPPGTFIRAGGGYSQPWTRDASVNTWSAASLLEPVVARNTLWAVVKQGSDGGLVVQQDDQWWDQCVWIVSAWNHYLVTGDRAFLADAYRTAVHTLDARRAADFDSEYGLFRGPGFFNDGIAGYPVPPATDPETSSFVLDYPGTRAQLTLSTNALYVEAYRRAALMATELGEPVAEAARLREAADSLTSSLNARFWLPDEGRYGYFIHHGDGDRDGSLDQSQEGTGLSFVILFHVADSARAHSILGRVHEEPWGIPDVWPHFARYDDDHPGRHNVIVWPMVQGLWARAAAEVGDAAVFAGEVTRLAALANDSDKGAGTFREIYNARTGVPDGGWQTGHHWDSEPDQTWSATAYLSMIHLGLFGMRFATSGMELQPLLPPEWGDVSLTGVPYRGMTLNITLTGAGGTVRSFTLDGVETPTHLVPATLTGTHRVEIALGAR